jgi:hypothetical protein
MLPSQTGPILTLQAEASAREAGEIARSGPPAVGARSRPIPTLAQLGLNGLARRLIGLQLTIVAVTAAAYPLLGLSLVWSTTLPHVLGLGVLAGVWAGQIGTPGNPREWVIAETFLVAFLLISFTCVISPAQYAAVALQRPLIDRWLAGADAALGFHVPALVAWTRAHRAVSYGLTAAYYSIGPQLLVPILVLGIVKRDRQALWEFCFHFHFCLLVTFLALAAFPAACAFDYYGFTSTLNEARFLRQFHGLRAGTLSVIRFDDLEGLISMPSFHAACGLMIPWALRRYRGAFLAAVCLNMAMIAATFMTGAHYVVDVLATVPLFAASVAAYRWWGATWVGVFLAPGEHTTAA